MEKHAHLDLFWAPSLVTTVQTLPLNNFMPTVEAKLSPRSIGKLIDCRDANYFLQRSFPSFLQASLLEKLSLQKQPKREFPKCFETLLLSTACCIGCGFLTQDK